MVTDNARVIESGLVYDNYKVSGNATVKGTAFCMVKGAADGQAMPDGDYYDDSSRTVSAGSVYGWTSPDSYVNSRPYNDGQYAGLEFDSDSSYIAADTFTSTYGTVQGAPTWNETLLSGNGVLTFDGSGDQYLIADSSYAALHDAEYQTAVLVRNDLNTIFRFGNNEKYMNLMAFGGNVVFAMNDGNGIQNVVAENVYEAGEWITISVNLSGDEATLTVNNGNEKKTVKATITIDPIDIVSEDATYTIGKSKNSVGNLNGHMDYFRVFFKDVEDPEYYYTEKENLFAESGLLGDLNNDVRVDVFDLVLMRKSVADGKNEFLKAADLNNDGSVTVADLVILQEFLLGKRKTLKGDLIFGTTIEEWT